jgi:hypothetical protein
MLLMIAASLHHCCSHCAAQLMMVSYPVPELEITRVPGSTFSTPGFRSSWWVSLKPEQQPKNPKAEMVLMYVHGAWGAGRHSSSSTSTSNGGSSSGTSIRESSKPLSVGGAVL